MHSTDSTLRFSVERGFSESYYVVCLICSNAAIKIIRWEDGTEESTGCLTCKRRERMMEEQEAEEGRRA